MKNIIEYYYNIPVDSLHNIDNYYYFDSNNRHFIFKEYLQDESRSFDMYRLTTTISNKLKIDNIILNRYNNPLTKVNDLYYILILNRNNYRISLPLISNMANTNVERAQSLERNDWERLWSERVDYYEMQISENVKKYPLIRESFDYFIGLAENAISYLINTKLEENKTNDDRKVISHNNLELSLTDPSNIILDHKARDVAEYIKRSFFNNNINIFNELDEYFYYNHYSAYGIRILFARVLYPSFYFILYDMIISGKTKENELNKVISRTYEYEKYLYRVQLYLKKYYNIPTVEWLKKIKT